MAGEIVSLIGDALPSYALLASKIRSISFIIPDVVVEEVLRDEMSVTNHPVETGAPIADHAFMNPSQVEMKCGFSDSTHQSEGYVDAVYQQMLALQSSRVPFDLTTGKRVYRNMLIRSIAVTNDEKSENALNVSIGLQQVNITSTSSVGGSGSNPSNSNPDGSNQSNPDQTAAPTDGGSQSIGIANGVPTFAETTGINAFATSPYGDLSGVGKFN